MQGVEFHLTGMRKLQRHILIDHTPKLCFYEAIARYLDFTPERVYTKSNNAHDLFPALLYFIFMSDLICSSEMKNCK